jgi:hypothetical protein
MIGRIMMAKRKRIKRARYDDSGGLRINPMRTCNFFHPDVVLFSGGTTKLGCLMMSTGLEARIAIEFVKDKRMMRLLYIKSFLPVEQFRKVMDHLIDGWWKK